MTVVERGDAPDAIDAPAIAWTWRRFADLSGDDVYAMLALRCEVFVVEQGCVFLDPDDCDRSAWHLLGRAVDDGSRPSLVAYLRAIDPGIKYDEPSIGRVVTVPRRRGTGLGRALVAEGIVRSRAIWPDADLVIGAQQRLEAFYASFGFVREGAIYDEDGIDHIQMRLRAA